MHHLRMTIERGKRCPVHRSHDQALLLVRQRLKGGE